MTNKGRKASQSTAPPHNKQERQKKQGSAGSITRNGGAWLLLLGLSVATLVAYQPAWHGGMLWDDDHHITHIGLRSLEGLQRIWFELGATQQYYPVVHSAFWVQHKLWGDDTLGYHLVSIVLHALSAFLVALILNRLAVPGAWLAAAIFALHPVQVESVAWIAELKNTLSGVFYLGAALIYLHFDKGRQKRLYVLAVVLFILALLSKTFTATLPAALAVVFWWQRGRLHLRRDLLPLFPFFALGAAAGLLTAWVERAVIGASGAEFQFTLVERFLIAGRAIWFYLGKLSWPSELIFIYPRWHISQRIAWQYLCPLGVAAIFLGLWLFRKHSRAPLAAMLLFCGALFPALGFLNVFPFRFSFVADHFQYLATIPVIALAAAGAANLVRRWNIHHGPAAAAMLVFVGTLAFLTWSQSHHYADAQTLYRATLSHNPSCWMAHNNLGEALLEGGQLEEAMAECREALRINPGLAQAHSNVGIALLKMGRLEEAIAECREALKINPTLPKPQINLGNILQGMGRFEEALAQYKEALSLNPNLAEAHNNLGNTLLKMGRLEDARVECQEALKINPNLAQAHSNLADVLQKMGRFEDAITQYTEALQQQPNSALVHNNIGLALIRLDRTEEAALHLQEALRLEPDFIAARCNLGDVLRGFGRNAEAIVQYGEVLRREPGSAEVQNNMGLALMGMNRFQEAAAHFMEALRLDPNLAEAHTNLAKALARIRTRD